MAPFVGGQHRPENVATYEKCLELHSHVASDETTPLLQCMWFSLSCYYCYVTHDRCGIAWSCVTTVLTPRIPQRKTELCLVNYRHKSKPNFCRCHVNRRKDTIIPVRATSCTLEVNPRASIRNVNSEAAAGLWATGHGCLKLSGCLFHSTASDIETMMTKQLKIWRFYQMKFPQLSCWKMDGLK